MRLFCLLLLVLWALNNAYQGYQNRWIVRRSLKICQGAQVTAPSLSFEWLSNYNKNYLQRQKIGRIQGKSEIFIEFQYLQQIVRHENRSLQHYYWEIADHLLNLKSVSQEIILGIKAETVESGITTLSQWVTGLELPRGLLFAYDTFGKEVLPTQLGERPVYIKYNSTDSGHAVMKPYGDAAFGVIFQGILTNPISTEAEHFYQFGDFPIYLFQNTRKSK